MARTDDDTWDLSNSVGATATGVAVGRAVASRGPNALISDPFAEPLVRAVGVNLFTRLASGELDPDVVEYLDTHGWATTASVPELAGAYGLSLPADTGDRAATLASLHYVTATRN
jgi:Leucine carboxyl methyltransferase